MALVNEPMTKLAEVSMAIAKHLFSKEEYQEKNIVFSPLSIQIILSIIAVGSEGTTQHQLLEFLQSDSTDQLKTLCSQLISHVSYALPDYGPAIRPLVSFVNGVWIQRSLSIQPSFKESVATDFKANIASVDFVSKALEVAKEVSSWAEKETEGLIKNILPHDAVDRLTNLIFANALYFRGEWLYEFDKSKTKDYDFYLLCGSSVKVPFMTNKVDQFISAFDGFKVLRLSYKGGQRFSMYFYLPDAKDGLLALIEKVASETDFVERTRPRDILPVGDVRIPRFNICYGFETSTLLKELGVVSPFSEAGGGLTKMVEDSPESEELYVSSIYHKSFIEVDEKGTEAAAATINVIRGGYCPPPMTPIDFVADHPFMFLIREDNSGTILFIGQVLNPKNG